MIEAIQTLKRKFEYFKQQEAITSDPEQKFSLAEKIQETNAKIAEMEAVTVNIPTSATNAFSADISRIDRYTPAELVGREAELVVLDEAWEKVRNQDPKRSHILTFVALGGEGKTSLVAKWVAGLAHRDWPGCEAAFAWSFYSQGTRDQTAASSDTFLREALIFFGDQEMAESATGAFDKGKRLARLVGARRALLILDGLEPLQYAPASPMAGELKDQGLSALLKGLAADSRGLCVVSTRYSLPALKAYWQTTAPEKKLLRLSAEAGTHLLKTSGVRGSTREFEKLVEDVKGHALTLNLLGSYLADAHGGDIRRRDLMKLVEADEEEQGGHAFRVMAAYEQAFEREGDKGKRALAFLHLLGLFDRPMSADCIAALLQFPAIPGLTEPLQGMTEAQLNMILTRLESARLITRNADASSLQTSSYTNQHSIDAHPLLREYFATHLRDDHPDAWTAGHRRLYEHLCTTTKEGDQPTLEDLQPLYQAVAHGCRAGLQQEACDVVYNSRILRGREFYSSKKLGAIGSDLGAVACFFETPWSRVSPRITYTYQAWLLNEAAIRLSSLGRLTEALEPMRVSGEMDVKVEKWIGAAISYSNLSELELTLGEVSGAVADAERSMTYADCSEELHQLIITRTARADALHQAGRRDEAEAVFREAEQMQAEYQPDYPILNSLWGFRYCDLLLNGPEREAGRLVLRPGDRGQESVFVSVCNSVEQRVMQTLKWAEQFNLSILDVAADYLTLNRAALYRAILERADFRLPPLNLTHIDRAVAGFRSAGEQIDLPRGLLTRAWLRSLTRLTGGPESAQSDLDEAWEIAERGPMPLFMADIHLYRARLFFREAAYPWGSPQADLKEARRLIEKHGYWRRREELEDAEAAIVQA